jgi:hypothetical protein
MGSGLEIIQSRTVYLEARIMSESIELFLNLRRHMAMERIQPGMGAAGEQIQPINQLGGDAQQFFCRGANIRFFAAIEQTIDGDDTFEGFAVIFEKYPKGMIAALQFFQSRSFAKLPAITKRINQSAEHAHFPAPIMVASLSASVTPQQPEFSTIRIS